MPIEEPAKVEIRNCLKPGDLGSIVWLHGKLYEIEYGFDHSFEPYVAEPLARFSRDPQPGESIWLAERDGKVLGSVAIVRFSDDVAQLRWLVLAPEARGLGLGRDLVKLAVDFARGSGYKSVFLWTLEFLTAAKALYESEGFVMTETKAYDRLWGLDNITEERYDLEF